MSGMLLRYRRLIVKLGMRGLQLLYRNKPVPVTKLMLLRRFSPDENGLFPAPRIIKSNGHVLRNPFLSCQLANTEIGTWSLGGNTLNFLEKQIQFTKPKVILEFGSGISTVCLTRYMQELHGHSDRVYVFSVEQDAVFAQTTKELLESLDLDKYCQIIHAPICEQRVKGIQTICYNLEDSSLKEMLADRSLEMVVIDGPSGAGSRFGTLPLIKPFLSPKTWFFLDDALRDRELYIAQLWERLFPEIQVYGILLIEKGLLIGQV